MKSLLIGTAVTEGPMNIAQTNPPQSSAPSELTLTLRSQ
jgi:hypothetical protein